MEITTQRRGNTCILHLIGELDEHTAANFRHHADHAIMGGVRHLVLVLDQLQFVDSAGLGVLMGRYRQLLSLDGRISLVAPRPHVQALLEMSGIARLMPFYRSQHQALAENG